MILVTTKTFHALTKEIKHLRQDGNNLTEM